MKHFTIRQFMDACRGTWYGPPELQIGRAHV